MGWFFGNNNNNNSNETSAQVSSIEPAKSEYSLGFDPSTVNVSSILSSPIDSTKLHPLAGLDRGLEYLNIEDDALSSLPGSQGIIPIKGWTDDLCYGTGTVYLLGLGVGGAYGLIEGLRKTPADASFKLRLNGILNAVTRRGPFLGNSAGVLTLIYNLINASIDKYRGKHDDWNSLASGAIAGAMFKCTKGPKPMLIASGLMAGAAGAWCAIKRAIF
ncbi:uncharacterized protein SAPINGB_P000008 [Magnusiomyces paraingens]|uniref:Mitochondrial import inner membrane translocase subunit TIM23 n=1 Tax=Magnusiomyces paraingens TaxID=2606893 RepID=A0A5E8AWU3_9ASCO|nr:uncharacterized protein SAPINGB_P000008 [Saprochaete ingens]VVT43487.1 unnamed protein product [Saprochaete ingens]